MNAVEDTKFAFLKAHEIIWEHGYWKYLLIPMILTATLLPLIFGGLIALAYYSATFIETYFADGENALLWVSYVIIAIIFTCVLGTGFVLYRNLIMVCYGPFLDQLSRKAEILINGHAREGDRPFIESILRPLTITVYAVIASFSTIVIGVLLGLIPLLGSILMFILLVPIQLFLGAVGYIDPYLERTGRSPKASFKLMRQHKWPVMVFSLTGLILLVVPFVGWFIAPTYSAVAGIVFGILMDAQEDSGQGLPLIPTTE